MQDTIIRANGKIRLMMNTVLREQQSREHTVVFAHLEENGHKVRRARTLINEVKSDVQEEISTSHNGEATDIDVFESNLRCALNQVDSTAPVHPPQLEQMMRLVEEAKRRHTRAMKVLKFIATYYVLDIVFIVVEILFTLWDRERRLRVKV